uniref:Uncharacterized protein n=1 Tax=Arundo donax TaxID=35708 RepID=A0A0A8YEG7_ARUDO
MNDIEIGTDVASMVDANNAADGDVCNVAAMTHTDSVTAGDGGDVAAVMDTGSVASGGLIVASDSSDTIAVATSTFGMAVAHGVFPFFINEPSIAATLCCGSATFGSGGVTRGDGNVEANGGSVIATDGNSAYIFSNMAWMLRRIAPISLKVLLGLLAISMALAFNAANDSTAEAMGRDRLALMPNPGRDRRTSNSNRIREIRTACITSVPSSVC